MSGQFSNDVELSKILARMGSLIEFQGITPTNVNDQGILGNTPLHIAAVSGDVRVGEILLNAGANPNIRGELGNTPLHEAVGQKQYEFAELLVKHGASKEIQNEDGLTPSDLAKMSGDLRLERILS